MKICICTSCRYKFRYPLIPQRCPDCGKNAVRIANEKEISDFHKEQRMIADEIRIGLYAAV